MALDEFQTRALALLQQSPYIASIAKPGRRITGIEYYAYNGTVGSVAVPLAPGVPQTVSFDTQADSDFAITFISGAIQELANGAMVYNDNVAWQITDLSTGKNFFNVPTVFGLTSGAGGFPFVLPSPRILNPNTTLAITATNRDTVVNGGAGPVGLFFAFHGTRIFYG